MALFLIFIFIFIFFCTISPLWFYLSLSLYFFLSCFLSSCLSTRQVDRIGGGRNGKGALEQDPSFFLSVHPFVHPLVRPPVRPSVRLLLLLFCCFGFGFVSEFVVSFLLLSKWSTSSSSFTSSSVEPLNPAESLSSWFYNWIGFFFVIFILYSIWICLFLGIAFFFTVFFEHFFLFTRSFIVLTLSVSWLQFCVLIIGSAAGFHHFRVNLSNWSNCRIWITSFNLDWFANEVHSVNWQVSNWIEQVWPFQKLVWFITFIVLTDAIRLFISMDDYSRRRWKSLDSFQLVR